MKRFFCVAILAALATGASAQNYPEHFELAVQLQYEVAELSQDAADSAGIEAQGVVNVDMLFPRPYCLAWYQSGSATYYSTETSIKAFDVNAQMPLRTEPAVQISNDLSGALDRLLFVFRPNMPLKTGGTVERLTIVSDMPIDTLDSNAFIEGRQLLREILNENGTQMRVFLASAPQAAIVMDVTGADVTISNLRGNSTRAEVATCTPPAGQP